MRGSYPLKTGDVALPLIPVAAVVGVLSRGVGEFHGEPLGLVVGSDARGDEVALGMADGLHMVGVPTVGETAVDDA